MNSYQHSLLAPQEIGHSPMSRNPLGVVGWKLSFPMVARVFGISIIGPDECLSLGISVESTESILSNIAQPSLLMSKSALTPLMLWWEGWVGLLR